MFARAAMCSIASSIEQSTFKSPAGGGITTIETESEA
jgi:hypothetical protein